MLLCVPAKRGWVTIVGEVPTENAGLNSLGLRVHSLVCGSFADRLRDSSSALQRFPTLGPMRQYRPLYRRGGPRSNHTDHDEAALYGYETL